MNEALKLADELKEESFVNEFPHPTVLEKQAAAMLLSQHAEIEQLKSEIKTEQSLSFREQAANQAEEIEVLKQESEGLRLEIQRQDASLRSYSTYVDWWKGKQAADTERLQERMDEIVSNDDRIIAIQRDEIERLKASNDSYITLANTAYEITDTLREENQKLRKVLESVATMSEELSISRFARAALVDTRIKGEEI